MHKIKLIHKDIKPANFLYSCHYKSAVLNDFGIS
jgi:serine/threonine protein kinase